MVRRPQLRLHHFFTATAVAAVWSWAVLGPPDYPLFTRIAVVFAVLAVSGSSWMTLTALFASLASLVEFPTCACGYLTSWHAFWVTIPACVVGWWGTWWASRDIKGRRIVSVCVAIVATTVVVDNLLDLVVLGHQAVFPNSPLADSPLPAANHLVLRLALLTAFTTAVLTLPGASYTVCVWERLQSEGTSATKVIIDPGTYLRSPAGSNNSIGLPSGSRI